MPHELVNVRPGSRDQVAIGCHRGARARRGRPAIDAGLPMRFRDGDPDAVRAAYSAYGRLVYAVSYAILGNRGLSEEATQLTFLKAWRAARTVDPGRELGPWLATVAKRVSIDIY